MTLTTDAPADPHAARATYHEHGLDHLSDQQLADWAARRLSVPREAAADSFILHAPLELAARVALLPFVQPSGREEARIRLLTLTHGYESWAAATPVADAATFDSPSDAAAALVTALDAGELDDVDAAAGWLGRHASAGQLRSLLAGVVLPHLGAAAHASIFLYQLARVAPRGEVTGELLRPLARELGRYPDWRLHWTDGAAPAVAGRAATAADVFAAVAATPNDPGLDASFIFPMMSYVDTHGIAASRLSVLAEVAPTDRPDVGRALLRVAAWSMLVEGDEAAPYGWSHCLTLPQAVLGIAGSVPDPLTALRIAGTYVVGFRSAQGTAPIEQTPPPDPGVGWRDALDADRATAAAAAWHVTPADRPALVGELATRAAVQHDAHLVKYTLACLDAVHDDPDHARLFLAAAASLGAYWHLHGNDEDPLA